MATMIEKQEFVSASKDVALNLVLQAHGQVLRIRLLGMWDLPDSQILIRPFRRWDEKTGLQRDAIRSQCSTCSRHKEKETGL
jgi:hypothetical protein